MYNPYSLEGKTILVTGASSGIGRATAIECSKLGATLVITARNEERLKATFNELDNSFEQVHQMILADLSSVKSIEDLVSSLPQLDGFSSNAGMAIGNKPIKFINEDEMLVMMQTNAFSHVSLTKLLCKKKKLNKNSSCVFTVSIGGIKSCVSGSALYGMTKGALDAFVRYAAIEMAPRGIRCNSICPGMIETPLTAPTGSVTEEDMQKDAASYLLKRYGQPEEVARAIVFLISDASSFITGTSLIVDGGYTVNH